MKKIVLIASLIFTACFHSSNVSLPSQAEEKIEQRQYDEAIRLYEKHIAIRLATDDRDDWENPYFYYLLIGDVHLMKDDPESALSNYIKAEDNKVEMDLVADRIRTLAKWYEDHQRLQDAFNLLEKYRAKDPLLFDSALDRISRLLTEQEDSHE